MDQNLELLFGVLALQADLLTNDQFAEACSAWVTCKHTPLADLLVERGWLTADDRRDVERLLGRKLKKHSGDVQASLAAAIQPPTRVLLAEIADTEIQHSLATCLRVEPGNSAAEARVLLSTTAYQPESRERYTLTRMHAKGGIGQIWLARDGDLGREVALKELRPERADHADASARFLEEARITGQLEHPGIVPVYELSRRSEDQKPFYTMRFVKGRTLAEAIVAYHRKREAGQAGPLDVRELLTVFIGVCQAVAYAHSRRVLHRDLKPQNVVLGDFGEVIVLDWGLAKLVGQEADGPASLLPVAVEPEGSRDQTVQGQVLGTPAYMSPEQAEGRLDRVEQRSDVYGLGAVLYEILTGQPPFVGEDIQSVLRQVIHEAPVAPRQRVATAPPALEAICLKALAKKPEDRYATAKELAAAVQRWLADEPVAAYPEPWSARAGRWIRRHRTGVAGTVAAVGVAAICLGAATVMLTASREREHQAKMQAQQNAQQAQEQRDKARDRFQLARAAVDRYYAQVSDSPEMKARGLEGLRTSLLAAAAEFYEKLIKEEGDNREVQAERGSALVLLGRLNQDTGKNQNAETAFLQSLAIWQKMERANPEESAPRVAVAETNHWLGRLYQKTGRADQAAKAYLEALVGLEGLTQEKPGEPYCAYLKAEVLNDQGVLWNQSGGRGQAETAFDRALAILAKLAHDYPGNALYQKGLAESHTCLAIIYTETGRRDGAEAAYLKAFEIDDRQAKAHPSSPEYQLDLATASYNLGYFYQHSSRDKDAEQAYRKALAIEEGLVREHRLVLEYQDLLANIHNMLGNLFGDTNRSAEAETAYLNALKIEEQLVRDNPGVPRYAVDQAGACCNLGGLCNDKGDFQAARSWYNKAGGILEVVLKQDIRNDQAQRYLRFTRMGMAALLRQIGTKEEALAAYRQVVTTMEQWVRADSSSTEAATYLAGSHCNLGHRLRENHQPQPALAEYDRAIEILEAVLRKDAKHSMAQANLCYSLQARAVILSKFKDRHEEALGDLRRAKEYAQAGEGEWIRATRACILARRGDHEQAVAEASAAVDTRATSSSTFAFAANAYALAASVVSGAKNLSTAERDKRVEAYAARAVVLLTRAQADGYFNTQALIDEFKSDVDFKLLRPRADFKKLLAALERKTKTPPP